MKCKKCQTEIKKEDFELYVYENQVEISFKCSSCRNEFFTKHKITENDFINLEPWIHHSWVHRIH